MADKHAKHRKVRFRRRDISRWQSLPSASAQSPDEIVKSRKTSSLPGALVKLTAFLVGAVVVIAIVLAAVGMTGLGTGRIESAAQGALSQLAGETIQTRFGDARLTWRGPGLIGLELRDATFRTARTELVSATAKRVNFGLELMPLLRGEVHLSGVSVSGVEVTLAGNPSTGGYGAIFDERGLVDPDKLVREVFVAAEKALSGTGQMGKRFELSDFKIVHSQSGAFPEIQIRYLEATRQGNTLTVKAQSQVYGQAVAMEASVSGPLAENEPLSFELTASVPAFRWDYTPGGLKKPLARSIDAEIAIRLAGNRDDNGANGKIEAVVDVDNLLLATFKDERQRSEAKLIATMEEGAGKVEIDSLKAKVGQSNLEFHGAVQPAPAETSSTPVYRYELVSDGSRIAASDAPERAIGVLARLGGILDPAEGRITADDLRVRTTGGEVFGNAAMIFPAGETPAVFLTITVPRMPVTHAKQLWPWKAADGARSWVLNNVFGGEVRDSWLEMSIVAGRLGDGMPFKPDEISGHFEIFGTRFDTAGDIPPVRDADGTVDFQGTDVSITLSSGTGYLPSGRTVDAANGTFAIDAARRPLVGALEIDVAGAADAVAELSSVEPIRADRFIDLSPQDFAGSVSGHVSANIPLQNVPDPDALNWRVALDYEELDIAKPFDGQLLSQATGSIVVDPEMAVIDAKGLLNGLPAEISLVEPLGDSGTARKRDLTLVLDNKAREKISPALNAILNGPVSVEIADGEGGRQQIVANLDQSELRFPWAGWRKGAGIPASVTFTVEEKGSLTRLNDIKLAGRSFSLSGNASIRDGQIQNAQFANITLNRGDSFDLKIDRNGTGYKLSVTGKRIDARSLINQFLSEDGKQEDLGDTPVILQAKAGVVSGFGNEDVSDVEVNFSGSGKKISGLQLSATTSSGKKFAVTQSGDADGRKVEMQSADAGAILRFLNIYDKMQGGSIDLRLAAAGNGPLRGQIDARDFWIVNEPRLKALVATAPEGDGRSLSQAVKKEIDVSKARFEQGFARIEKGDGYLTIADGVLRGPVIGSTFQGQLYDAEGRISVTGTFMPAYGLNRIFGELPLVGLILGNGRDRGLIGITYKLSGDAKSPRLQVNPISVIAPGIFRQIFEFR